MLCDCVFRVFGAHIGRKEDGAMLVVIPSSETHIVLEMQGKKRQLPGLVIFWFCFNNLIKLKLRLCRVIIIHKAQSQSTLQNTTSVFGMYYDKIINCKR